MVKYQTWGHLDVLSKKHQFKLQSVREVLLRWFSEMPYDKRWKVFYLPSFGKNEVEGRRLLSELLQDELDNNV